MENRRVDPVSGCWLWTGPLNPDGYGQMTFGPRTAPTHRVAYELIVGPIPEGKVIDHECHNMDLDCIGQQAECLHRRCFWPHHLRVRTPAQNSCSMNYYGYRQADLRRFWAREEGMAVDWASWQAAIAAGDQRCGAGLTC